MLYRILKLKNRLITILFCIFSYLFIYLFIYYVNRNKNLFKNLNSLNYHLNKNLFRPTPENVGSYSRVFTVEIKYSTIIPRARMASE